MQTYGKTKSNLSMAGVTLLEIMLVLAIAAMIIVMSIRYYQSASQSQQSTQVLNTVTAVTAVVENLAVGTGNYSAISSAQVATMLPNGANLKSPWGGNIQYGKMGNGFKLTFTPVMPAGVCTQVKSQLETNNKYAVTCTDITYSSYAAAPQNT